MRRRRIGKSELETYYPNCNDRGYKAAEHAFVDANVFVPIRERQTNEAINRRQTILNDPTIPQLKKESQEQYFIRTILQNKQRKLDGTIRYNDNVYRIVVEVIKKYGMSAFRLDDLMKQKITLKPKEIRLVEGRLHPSAKMREEAERRQLRDLDSLGGVVCEIIREWQQDILNGSPDERRKATKWLRASFACLIPETRGMRKNKLTGNKYDVMEFYYRELFRLSHIQNALRSSHGPHNTSLKVKQTSENYGLPIKIIREFWGLDEKDQPYRQPFSLKDMARELTARQFNIKHQTISNFLSF